jgi:hypothetical protein
VLEVGARVQGQKIPEGRVEVIFLVVRNEELQEGKESIMCIRSVGDMVMTGYLGVGGMLSRRFFGRRIGRMIPDYEEVDIARGRMMTGPHLTGVAYGWMGL